MSAAGPSGLPAELVRCFRRLREHGLNDSHSGNASCRDGDTVWITPTGCCADSLEAGDLLRARIGSPPPAGASLDAALHLAVYDAVPDAVAVLHSHGPHAIALSLSGEDFEPGDFEGRYHFGRVPVLRIPYDAYVDESPGRVAEALVRHRVAIIRGHGIYARGASVDEAYKWTCSLESSARVTWLARVAGITGSEDG